MINSSTIFSNSNKEKQTFISNTLDKISERNGVWIGMKRDVEEKFLWIDGMLLLLHRVLHVLHTCVTCSITRVHPSILCFPQHLAHLSKHKANC